MPDTQKKKKKMSTKPLTRIKSCMRYTSHRTSTANSCTALYIFSENSPFPRNRWKRNQSSQFSVEPKRLIFQGRILNKDGQTLTECKLKDGLTVVVQTVPAGKAPTPASPPPTPAVPSTPAPSSNLAGQPSAAAFAGLPPLGGPAASTPIGLAVATVKGQPAGVARECLTTLVKIIDNIVQHPLEEKYRKIKRANAGFRRKVNGMLSVRLMSRTMKRAANCFVILYRGLVLEHARSSPRLVKHITGLVYTEIRVFMTVRCSSNAVTKSSPVRKLSGRKCARRRSVHDGSRLH